MYVPGYGETTAGDIRAPLAEVPYDKEDAMMRMWVWTTLYAPKGTKPLKDGFIRHKGKEYPLSIFNDDRFIRLYTSSGDYRDLDVNDASALKEHAKRVLKRARQLI